MKKNILYITIFSFAALFMACDENEIMPAYEKVGTSTHTAASISFSDDEIEAGEAVIVSVKYVHPSSDPLTEVQLNMKVGAAAYVPLETYTLQSSQLDTEVTHTINYVAPASGTTVVFEMVLKSGKEYPQYKRSSFKVL